MKINLIWIGKAKYKFTIEAVDLYLKRLKHYTKVEVIELKDVKAKTSSLQKEAESKLFQKILNSNSYVICLHEYGKEFSSIQLSKKIAKLQNASMKEVNIIIGGAFGFHKSFLDKANEKWSMGKMTFPHDLCRILITEQLYRAFTIIKNEKYHNP